MLLKLQQVALFIAGADGFNAVLPCGQRGNIHQIGIWRLFIEHLPEVIRRRFRVNKTVFNLYRNVIFVMHNLGVKQRITDGNPQLERLIGVRLAGLAH